MKKRIFLGLVLAAVAAGGAFALPELKLSAGVGGYFTSDFGGGVKGSSGGYTISGKTPYAGGGGFAFFDATFMELSLGFWGGGSTFTMESGGGTVETDLSVMGLDIGLLGKYPLAVNEKLSVFPLLGITYRIMLSVKNEDGDQLKNSDGDDAAGDFSALWFRLGAGVDYSFTDQVYVRGGLLYGLRLANKFENDYVDTIPSAADPKTLLGHGLEIKIAVGYRF
ncbi:MAG: outer membrane beta-barrel protein [Treponema sp.]|jgi:hypothetical protein|nr:outer membrane beta-barrel protein [Treponema sp.]